MYTVLVEYETDMRVIEFFDSFAEATFYADYYALFTEVLATEVILTETCETCYSCENVIRPSRWL
jgi:hypothetical protein